MHQKTACRFRLLAIDILSGRPMAFSRFFPRRDDLDIGRIAYATFSDNRKGKYKPEDNAMASPHLQLLDSGR